MVGPGGAGKSTFSEALAARTGLPVVHLDRWYWKPGWVEPDRAEWETIQSDLVAAECWIADGNYGGTLDLRLGRADAVIVLAPSRLVCILGVLGRSLRHHGEAVQAAGCPERVTVEFLRWVWRYPIDSRPRLGAAIGRHPHLEVIELTSRRMAAAWLRELEGHVGGR